VVPETVDDFWHLYNIIVHGDLVYAHTTREVKPDAKYARPVRGERVSVFVGLKVEDVAWDRFLGRLRIHGTICEAPETVPTGVHHTLSITLNTPLTIVKEKWSRHQIDRLETARRISEKPLMILSIDDEGYAIATTAQYGLELKVEERTKLPGKLEAEKRTAATAAYFRKVSTELRKIWEETHAPIAIIGVGFVKNDFARYLKNEMSEVAEEVVDVKSVNNGGMAGVQEALRSGVLSKTMRQLRIGEEAAVIEEVLKRLGKGERNVAYGPEEVHNAVQLGAVETLVVADTMLRDVEDAKRLSIEALMTAAEKKAGNVMVISTLHEAGAKLISLGGVAALLRFPI